MKAFLCVLGLLTYCLSASYAQEYGNRIFNSNFQMIGTSNISVQYLSDTSFYINAQVMQNVKADSYSMVFAVHQLCDEVEACHTTINRRIAAFEKKITALGIPKESIFVDAISQTRIYEFQPNGNIIEEKLAGFELKKNIIIQYKKEELFDKLVLAAAKENIFDLVKVDYIIKDTEAIYDKLLAEAYQIIERKEQSILEMTPDQKYKRVQVYQADMKTIFPAEQYQKYTAFSTNKWSRHQNSRQDIKHARKVSTYYFEGQHTGQVDKVINPNQLKPPVQYILTLKIKYIQN